MSERADPTVEIRRATHDDYDAVAAFTGEIWDDRGGDYIPDVYHDWIESDDLPKRTLVADAGDGIAGIAQCVLVTDREGWCQGMRVNPDYRGEGIALALSDELFAWARNRGATVARNMVFSWNEAGLGQSRAAGFAPATAFRWLHPEPDPTADPNATAGSVRGTDADVTVVDDPAAAWRAFHGSDADRHLDGLALSLDESWALCELTPAILERAAAETAVRTVVDDRGAVATSFRTRTYDRKNDDGEVERWAEYGAAAWRDVDALRPLLAAIRADAAAVDADRTRVLIPETPRHVSDGAYARGGISEHLDFVMAADLTRLGEPADGDVSRR